jgi:cyclic pyranopterin phosphate synthase
MMLSHIDEEGRPEMVDVSAKNATTRTATAESIVELPPEILKVVSGNEILGPKGPVIQTSIIAGTMAAKRTAIQYRFVTRLLSIRSSSTLQLMTKG